MALAIIQTKKDSDLDQAGDSENDYVFGWNLYSEVQGR